MNRRRFLRSIPRFSVVAGVAASAGCTETAAPTGPRTPPRSPEATDSGGEGLVVTDFEDVEGDDGRLLVRVTIENRGAEPQSGTVVVDVRAGETEKTVTKDVTVESGERTEVTLSTSVAYEEFSRDGSMRVEIA